MRLRLPLFGLTFQQHGAICFFSYSDFSDYMNNSGDIIRGYPIHSYHSPVFIQLNNFTFPLQT